MFADLHRFDEDEAFRGGGGGECLLRLSPAAVPSSDLQSLHALVVSCDWLVALDSGGVPSL